LYLLDFYLKPPILGVFDEWPGPPFSASFFPDLAIYKNSFGNMGAAEHFAEPCDLSQNPLKKMGVG
jgi:hypothetical protein